MINSVAKDANINEFNTIEPLPVNTNDIQVKKELTPTERILEAYKRKVEDAPKPTFDTTTPEYMKRAAKMNAIGKGFSALADAFSLAKGGNVNTPVNDGKVQGYINNYFKSLDDYRNKVDQYDLMKYNNDLRLNELMFQDARNQEAIDRSQANRNEDIARQDKRFDKQDEQWQKSFDRQGEQIKQQQENWEKQFDWQKQLPYINASLDAAKRRNELADWLQKETLKLQLDKQGKSYTLFDNKGVARASIQDEGDIQKLYTIITADPEVSKQATALMDVLKAQLGEGVTMNHMKVVVSKLWDVSPQAQEYLQRGQSSSPGEKQPTSQTTTQQNQQGNLSSNDIPSLIKSGKTNEAYQILKNDGYSDEDIQKAFEKLAPELFKVEPKKVELNSETFIEAPRPEQLTEIISKYPQSVQSIFDEKPSILGGANRVGNAGKALKIAEQIAKEKGLQGKQALDYAYQIKDEILKDINAYDNINNTIKQQEVKEGKKRMREAMLEMNKL